MGGAARQSREGRSETWGVFPAVTQKEGGGRVASRAGGEGQSFQETWYEASAQCKAEG